MTEARDTRTLLFGLFVVAEQPLTAAQAIALARPLGLSASNVKSHLTRLVAEGALQRSGPRRLARYWPSGTQKAVVEGIAARLQPEPRERWDGRWLILALRLPADRSARDRLRASLWFDGFRPWGSDTFIRPAWPRRWSLDRVRAALAARGGMCVHGDLVGRLAMDRVRRMYAIADLDREARRLTRTISPSRARVSPARAFAMRLRIGGHVAALVGHDPRLPPEIWGSRTGLRDVVRRYRGFDKALAPLATRFVQQVLTPAHRTRAL